MSELNDDLRQKLLEKMNVKYYDRKGKQIDLMEWVQKCGDPQYRIIKQEDIDKYSISTIWMGLDMNMFGNPKHIFETMIFINEGTEEEQQKDPLNLYQERYSTEEEAMKGHEIAIAIVEKSLIHNMIKQSQQAEKQKDSQPEHPDLST